MRRSRDRRRWSIRLFGLPSDELLKEIDDILAHTRDQRLKLEGAFARAYARVYDSRPGDHLDPSIVEEYLGLAPQDPRGATLLHLAANRTTDERATTALEDRIIRQFLGTSPRCPR